MRLPQATRLLNQGAVFGKQFFEVGEFLVFKFLWRLSEISGSSRKAGAQHLIFQTWAPSR